MHCSDRNRELTPLQVLFTVNVQNILSAAYNGVGTPDIYLDVETVRQGRKVCWMLEKILKIHLNDLRSGFGFVQLSILSPRLPSSVVSARLSFESPMIENIESLYTPL